MATKEPVATIASKTPDHVLCAAIDFGTTYSGYAFSHRDNAKMIFCPTWTGANFSSLKTPTCLLLDPQQNFHSFGYSAETKYAELANDDEQEDWFYFKNFKMKLHSQEHPVKRNTVLTEEGGKKLSAITVFSTSIRFLRKEVIREKDEQFKTEGKIKDEEIRWVLTVPAIWDEEAKQFMREAAEEAGIPREHLILALEPEAASIFVKEMNVKRDLTNDDHLILSPYEPGTKFMVVDLGGGTVDITVREVMEDRSLKELYKACGNAKGGNTVNEEIYKFLKEIVGEDVFDEFCRTNKAAAFDLEKEIESKKRTLEGDTSGKIPVNLPAALLELFRTRKGVDLTKSQAVKTNFAETVALKGAKLRVSHTLFPDFFKSAGESIAKTIREILSNDFAVGLKDIILVGGFADCPMIRHSFEQVLEDLSFIIPNEAGLAVVKGAVLYGHNPNVVSARVCRYTYGTEVHRYFLKGEDDESKREIIDGNPYCKQVFNKLAEISQTFNVGDKVVTDVFPLTADLTKMTVKVYKSTEKNPKYISDNGCTYIGKIVVDMPDTTEGLNRRVLVSLRFGDTELKLEAKDEKTDRPVSVNLDMLS